MWNIFNDILGNDRISRWFMDIRNSVASCGWGEHDKAITPPKKNYKHFHKRRFYGKTKISPANLRLIPSK
jgi:hypothetical protein